MEKGKLKELFVTGNMPSGAEYKAALKDVLHTFPYFQIAQILFAKQLYDTHEPEASGRIQFASVYAPDRKAMYHLFKKPLKNNEEIKLSQSVGESIKPPEKGKVNYNFVYSSTAREDTGVTDIPVKKETRQESLSETFIRKELETKPAITIPEKQSEKIAEPIAAPAKKPYTKPTIEKKRSLYTQKTEKPADKPKTIIKPPVEKIEPAIPVMEVKKPEPEKEFTPEALTPAKIDSPLVEDKKAGAESIPKEPIQDTSISVNQEEPLVESNLKYSFSAWLKVLPEVGVEKKIGIKPLSPSETATIIDKFLKEEPTISRPKAEFFSPVKAAKMSIIEDDMLVSETLAKIFFEQGNLHKALKAYQGLLVQFPEKKNIFAPRIEKIETLMRENTKPKAK